MSHLSTCVAFGHLRRSILNMKITRFSYVTENINHHSDISVTTKRRGGCICYYRQVTGCLSIRNNFHAKSGRGGPKHVRGGPEHVRARWSEGRQRKVTTVNTTEIPFPSKWLLPCLQFYKRCRSQFHSILEIAYFSPNSSTVTHELRAT